MQVTVAVDVSKLNVRWEEPYVSQGLNRKALALPSGAYRGLWFFTKNDANLYLSVDPDSLGMDKQHFGVIEDRTNGFAISFRDTGSLTIDCSTLLTGGAAQTFYVWIEADYTVSSATTGTIVVSNVIGDIPSDGYIFLGLIDVDVTPQPTKVDAYSNYSAGDKQFGFIEGQERRNLPINNEKNAMTASTSPSSSNPFVTHSCQIPLVVDVRTYGAGSNYDAITGYGKGAGKGVVGISQTGIGGNFTGGNALASTDNNGGPGAFAQGGVGDGTGDGGRGGNFVGGVSGDTGTGGFGTYSVGGAAGTSGNGGSGVFGQAGNPGSGDEGIGVIGLAYGVSFTLSALLKGAGVYGHASDGKIGGVFLGNGASTSGIPERQGVFARGGQTTTVAGPGGQFTGGSPSTSGNGGTGVVASGGNAPASGDGGHGVRAFGGDSDSGDGGHGIHGTGGDSTSGAGGAGVYGLGGSADGPGVLGEGGGGGPGVVGIGDGASPTITWRGQGGIFEGGFTSTIGYAGGEFIGGEPTTSGAGGVGLVSTGADAANGNGGHGGVFRGGGKNGLANDGCAVVALGDGASTTVPAGAYGAGIYAIGGGGKPGGYFKGGTSDVGAYFEGATNAAAVQLAVGSDPTTGSVAGQLAMFTGGFLKAYFGSAWRFVGCQAWAHVRTGGGSPVLDDEIGIASVSYQTLPNRVRLTFDTAFSNNDYSAVATHNGTNLEFCNIYAQTTTYVDVVVVDPSGPSIVDVSSLVREFNVSINGK